MSVSAIFYAYFHTDFNMKQTKVNKQNPNRILIGILIIVTLLKLIKALTNQTTSVFIVPAGLYNTHYLPRRPKYFF